MLARMASSSPARLPWIDHVRTFVIFLVVAMHACVTYSHVGDWYFMSPHEPEMVPTKLVFLVWQGHLQAFFMGLLFLLAGYFAWFSLQRRGPGGFLRERLVRLGLPTLLYMLVIHPFILLALNPWRHDFGPKLAWYRRFVLSGEFLGESGPLWFAFALLIFSALLALWNLVGGVPSPRTAEKPGEGTGPTVTAGKLLALGAVLSLTTFAVRLVQPVGTNVSNFQLCFFPQYIVVFILGVCLARRGALAEVARSPVAARAGWVALIGGPLLLAAVMVAGGPIPTSGPNPYFGGPHWQALGLATWEQFAGVGLGIGVLAWFARKFDRETPLLRWLGDRAFGVYVLHAPVLVALTMLCAPLEPAAGPFGMAVLVTLAGLAVSYALADLAKRVPGLKSIL